MYKILLAKNAQKTYSRLSPKLRKGVDRCIEYLKLSPKYTVNTKELQGVYGCYRYQMGGWRILLGTNPNVKIKLF